MAFTDEEKKIIEWGLKNGKSRSETEGALLRYRTTGSPADPTKVATPTTTTPNPIVSAFKSRVSKATDAQEKSVRGEQSLASGVIQTIGQGAGFVGDVAFEGIKAVTPDTVERIIGEGAKAIAGTQPVQDVATRYTEWKQANPEAAANLEATLNVASILPVGTGVKAAGELAVKGVSKVAEKTVDALSGISAKGTEGIAQATSRALNPADIMQRVARIPKTRQVNFERLSGKPVGQYLVDNGIFGDVDEITGKLFERFSQSKSNADTALASLKGTFKPTQIKTALDELFSRETRVSTKGALSPDFQRVRELRNKLSTTGLDMSEINEVKRIYERNIRLDFVKQNLPEGIARATNLDSAIRNWQLTKARELGLKNLDAINKETQLAKTLLDDLGKEYAGSQANNLITLTDWIVLAGGDPTAVGAFLTKKALSSKKILSKVAEKLSGSEPKPPVAPEFGEPTIDAYLKFLETTGGRKTPQ